jgi:hypothetical protein
MNPITQYSLTIILCNANSLIPHKDKLDILIHHKRIDIALITETPLTDRYYLIITDYRLYRTDHPDNRAQGGAPMLIAHNVSHHIISNNHTDFLITTSLSITTSHFSITV